MLRPAKQLIKTLQIKIVNNHHFSENIILQLSHKLNICVLLLLLGKGRNCKSNGPQQTSVRYSNETSNKCWTLIQVCAFIFPLSMMRCHITRVQSRWDIWSPGETSDKGLSNQAPSNRKNEVRGHVTPHEYLVRRQCWSPKIDPINGRVTFPKLFLSFNLNLHSSQILSEQN